MKHLLPVALLALLLPGLAVAGPIEWSYTAHVRAASGDGVLNLGMFTAVSGGPESIPLAYYMTVPLAEQHLTGSGTGDQTFPLFHAGDGWQMHYLTGTNPLPAPSGFLVTFTLTDTASGESGVIEYTGTLGVSTTNEAPVSVLFTLGMGPQSQDLVLGQNQFVVTALGGVPDEIGEPAGAWLSISAAPTNTPEPATLVLVGVGLAAVGVAAGRKRAK